MLAKRFYAKLSSQTCDQRKTTVLWCKEEKEENSVKKINEVFLLFISESGDKFASTPSPQSAVDDTGYGTHVGRPDCIINKAKRLLRELRVRAAGREGSLTLNMDCSKAAWHE